MKAKPPETLYQGVRHEDGVTVTRNGITLSPAPSQRIRNASPTGFEWGYGGSGPAQLALALVLDATGDEYEARRAHQWFKWAQVSQWGTTWSITAAGILAWLDQFHRESESEDTPLEVIAEEWHLPFRPIADGGVS